MVQAARLAFRFTVYAVVRLSVDGVGRAKGRDALHQMVADALASADITHLAARSYKTRSGGEQQRAQFARVLGRLTAGRSMPDRQVLFLDEPVASLDLCHKFGSVSISNSPSLIFFPPPRVPCYTTRQT